MQHGKKASLDFAMRAQWRREVLPGQIMKENMGETPQAIMLRRVSVKFTSLSKAKLREEREKKAREVPGKSTLNYALAA